MNRTLKKLPASTGVMVGEQRVNHLAYADDVVLLAETKTGLQHMLHVYQKGLARCGFVINVKKSATLDMETVPKDRQLVVNISSNFRCGPDSLPSMRAAEFYKYLGVDTGGTRGRAINVLEHKLDHLRRAPFEPQQRLWILKVYVIPSLYQLLVLGRTTRVELLGLDRVIRRTIRRWMAWPKDAPLPMYTTQEGTMWHSRCLNSHGQFHYLKRQLANLEKFKPGSATAVRSKKVALEAQAAALQSSVDGRGLESMALAGGQDTLLNGTNLMACGMFINAMKIRGNLMMAKARHTRWHHQQDPNCDTCERRETATHCLQTCPKSWGAIIKRHDLAVALIRRALERKGYEAIEEPIIKAGRGIRKPDLVATKEGRSWVLDAAVTGYNTNLDWQADQKTAYYDIDEVNDLIRERTGSQEFNLGRNVTSWRGALAPKTMRLLVDLDVPKSTIKLLVVRTLEGSVWTWKMWRKSVYSKGSLDEEMTADGKPTRICQTRHTKAVSKLRLAYPL